jgi:bifunctional DNase/RNase
VAAASGGIAVFLGNEEKVFLIYVDQSVGVAIAMFMQGTQRERPLTHDLLANILRALEAKIDRVIVNDLKHGTYFARLVLSAENELNQKKIIEIDARPSDCVAMAIQQSAPIYVSVDVWDAVEDMTETLRKMQEEGPPAEQSDGSMLAWAKLSSRRAPLAAMCLPRLSPYCHGPNLNRP